jgi:tRNA 2-thiouridine synthesizing protein A
MFEGQETLSFASAKELTGDRQIDITAETCPMTFVRTRLALDRMASGETLLVRLRGDEPRRNIPKTATEQGHTVLAEAEAEDGAVLLLLRKG